MFLVTLPPLGLVWSTWSWSLCVRATDHNLMELELPLSLTHVGGPLKLGVHCDFQHDFDINFDLITLF